MLRSRNVSGEAGIQLQEEVFKSCQMLGRAFSKDGDAGEGRQDCLLFLFSHPQQSSRDCAKRFGAIFRDDLPTTTRYHLATRPLVARATGPIEACQAGWLDKEPTTRLLPQNPASLSFQTSQGTLASPCKYSSKHLI